MRGISTVAALSILAGVIGLGVIGTAVVAWQYVGNQFNNNIQTPYHVPTYYSFNLCDYFSLNDASKILNHAGWASDYSNPTQCVDIPHNKNGPTALRFSDQSLVQTGGYIYTDSSGSKKLTMPEGYEENLSIELIDPMIPDGQGQLPPMPGPSYDEHWSLDAFSTGMITSGTLYVAKNCLLFRIGIEVDNHTHDLKTSPLSEQYVHDQADKVFNILDLNGLFDKGYIQIRNNEGSLDGFIAPNCTPSIDPSVMSSSTMASTNLSIDDIFPIPDLDISNLDLWGRLKNPSQPTNSRLLPGMKVFHTFRPEDYVATLKPDQVLIHLPSFDTVADGPAYAVDTLTHVLQVEKNKNSVNDFTYDVQDELNVINGDSPDAISQINTILDHFSVKITADQNMLAGMQSTFQQNVDLNNSVDRVITYVDTLPQNVKGENVESIYDAVQLNLRQNAAAGGADGLDPQSAIDTGIGVCRDGATYLAEALIENGVDASVVFDQNHAWVRVANDGSGTGPYDLDVNAYESFVKVPVRTVIPYQIMPVVPIGATPPEGQGVYPILNLNYLKQILQLPIAHAQTVSSSSSVEHLCLGVGTCLSFASPIYVVQNSHASSTFVQIHGDTWSEVSFVVNPPFVFKPTGTAQSIPLLLVDQKRQAVEYTETMPDGTVVHTMYSDYIRSDGAEVVVGVMSNAPILKPSDNGLLKTLAGWNPVSYAF